MSNWWHEKKCIYNVFVIFSLTAACTISFPIQIPVTVSRFALGVRQIGGASVWDLLLDSLVYQLTSGLPFAGIRVHNKSLSTRPSASQSSSHGGRSRFGYKNCGSPGCWHQLSPKAIPKHHAVHQLATIQSPSGASCLPEYRIPNPERPNTR